MNTFQITFSFLTFLFLVLSNKIVKATEKDKSMLLQAENWIANKLHLQLESDNNQGRTVLWSSERLSKKFWLWFDD